jgi:hypothetical protein
MCYELRRLQVSHNSFEEALVASLILSHRRFNVRELELLNGGYTSIEYAENLSSSKVHRTTIHATHACITHIVKCLTFILLSRHSLRRYKEQFPKPNLIGSTPHNAQTPLSPYKKIVNPDL